MNRINIEDKDGRRIFSIDTGDMTSKQARQFLNNVVHEIRKKKSK